MRASLILASEEDNIEVTRELCERGANVNAASTDGFTVLMSASEEGHLENREFRQRGVHLR